MSAPMPSKYIAGPFIQYSAQPGGDIMNVNRMSDIVRPKISISGGKRRSHRLSRQSRQSRHSKRKVTRHHRKSRKQQGGFIPSIGEGFAVAAAKYITPVALYGLYRFINNKKTRKTRKASHTRRR